MCSTSAVRATRSPERCATWSRFETGPAGSRAVGRRASRCQIDHAEAWEDGGGTDVANLGMLCVRHHQLKTHGGWVLTESAADGSCTWTSPLAAKVPAPGGRPAARGRAGSHTSGQSPPHRLESWRPRGRPRRVGERSTVALLDGIRDPRDVRALSPDQLPELAAEIRAFLVEKVSATGGHLGPNLGVVELTIALHRIFRSPDDMIVWDTGHQAYVHKILTGRGPDFDDLRQRGGLSGYPSRAGEPARPRRELARVHRAVLCRRAREGVGAARTPRAAARGRGRSVTARSPAAWPGRRSTTSRRRTGPW